MKTQAPQSNNVANLQAGEARLRTLFLSGLAGDAGEYQSFLKEMSTHLRAYYRRRLMAWPDEVEDLVQETLLALHNQRHTYQSHQPLTAWVHAIARYKWIDLLRARGSREALHDPLDDELQIFATSDIDASDAKRDVGRLLQQLPDSQRLPILHTKLQGLSVVEAALATGMSQAAVKVGVHRGMKALAALLGVRT